MTAVSRPGRNDPCACGSGKKYKHCCALAPAPSRPTATIEPSTTRMLISLARAGRHAELIVRARALLERHPHAGFLWKALSVGLEAQGENALTALEKAAELLPDDAEAHSNLGTALRRAGRFEEAEACFRRALALRPAVAEVLSNLGNVLADTGRLEEAVAVYREALELKPGFAKSHNNLANALKELGRIDEAVEGYRRAIELDPGYAEAYCNLAVALRMQGAWVDAERMCRRALKVSPDSAAPWTFLGELCSDRGEFDSAEEHFRRALSLDGRSAEALAGLVRFRRMGPADGQWLERAQGVLQGGLGSRQEVYLRYAMGKYFDDMGEWAQAFEQYERANELSKQHRARHDREQVERGIERIIEVFDERWLKGHVGVGLDSARPVLVVGMPRSGTTLAEQILASHAEVYGAGELSYWGEAAAGYVAGVPEEREVLKGLGQGYLRVLETLSSNARRVVDKMPGNFLYLGMICAALPNARIIHMRRQPIDTCLSIYFQNFGGLHTYANDLEDLAHYYRQYLRLMEHWRGLLPDGVMLEVRYEELVQDPEGWSRRMVAHAGLEWHARCLEFYATVRPLNTFSKWQARQRISTASIERWRHYEPFVSPLITLEEAV